MIRHRHCNLCYVLTLVFILSFTLLSGQFGATALAEGEAPEVETPIPTQPPPTDTPTPTPTDTPTSTPTTEPPTPIPPTNTPTPLPPAEIPEPITVILFGTGLAALSAAAARRRRAE